MGMGPPVERGHRLGVLHASLMTQPQTVVGMWTHGMTSPLVFMVPATSELPIVVEAW